MSLAFAVMATSTNHVFLLAAAVESTRASTASKAACNLVCKKDQKQIAPDLAPRGKKTPYSLARPPPPRVRKQQTCSAMTARLIISSCPPASLASARCPTIGLATGTTPTILPVELGGTNRTSFTAESGRSRSRARRSPSRRSVLELTPD